MIQTFFERDSVCRSRELIRFHEVPLVCRKDYRLNDPRPEPNRVQHTGSLPAPLLYGPDVKKFEEKFLLRRSNSTTTFRRSTGTKLRLRNLQLSNFLAQISEARRTRTKLQFLRQNSSLLDSASVKPQTKGANHSNLD